MKPFNLDPAVYPLPPSLHPSRPWWAEDGAAWRGDRRRVDGLQVYADNPEGHMQWVAKWSKWSKKTDWEPITRPWPLDPGGAYPLRDAFLAELDALYPLPVPPPRPGQEWVWPNGTSTSVLAIEEGKPVMAFYREVLVNELMHIQCGVEPLPEWPPPGAVLVAGPFSPWSPIEAKPQ